ncbi:MAG TPA: hypothetical protein VL992_08585 [Tepidisphaeraceae bacterium]|nr:hypothetical protein [Tepidisphaeraceae bacterium]
MKSPVLIGNLILAVALLAIVRAQCQISPQGSSPQSQNQPPPMPSYIFHKASRAGSGDQFADGFGDFPAAASDDEALWNSAAGDGPRAALARTVRVKGRTIAIQAIELLEEPDAHILLRLRTEDGSTVTVDVGHQLAIPMNVDADVQVIGEVGAIDQSPVLFADTVIIGSHKINLQREHHLQELAE